MKRRSKRKIEEFPDLLDALAWRSQISEDGKFRRMERQGIVKMYHSHDDYCNEMAWNDKTKVWKCPCGARLEAK